MQKTNTKRFLSFLMALLMIFSLVPFQTFATETDTHDHETSEEQDTVKATEAPVNTALLESIQAAIDDMLNWYLGTTQMTTEEVYTAVADMTDDDYWMALTEVVELEESEEIQQLTETEAQLLVEQNTVFSDFGSALYERRAKDTSVSLLATTVTPLEGQVSVTDSSGNGSLSSGVVTVKASGNLFSKATNTITITNESDARATIKFDYSASSYNSLTIGGESASASGNYSVTLDAGASLTISLQSKQGLSDTTATLTLSNFSYTVASANPKVSVAYNATYGSVTMNDEAVTSKEYTSGATVTLVATQASGATFLGWVNTTDNSIASQSATYSFAAETDTSLKAIFGSTNLPCFYVGAATQTSESTGLLGMSKLYYYTVGTGYLFDDLNAAATAAAASSNNKAVVLANSSTLPAGDYTIPAGVTLLIPFDDVNTMYTTAASAEGTYTAPSAYRTLTMATGANLIINGAMSVSAKHSYASGAAPYYAAPIGKCGFVSMAVGSSITVNNGGTLYAYGFITGSGSVTAKSGATVYELFQIMDFRGGSVSTQMENGVFPLSQYYVQNIEVPLTYETGAKEYGYTTIYMSSAEFGSSVEFIGTSSGNAMFKIVSGSCVKDYDETNDRLDITVDGDLTMSNMLLDIGGTEIDSADYDLPLNNMTVTFNSGTTTISQDLALIPSTQFIVNEGATITLSSSYNIYIYDADNWGSFCYSGGIKKYVAAKYAPGRTNARTEASLVDASVLVNGTIDAGAGYVYSANGSANIYSTGSGVVKATAGTQTVTYQLVQGTGYTEIPLTPVQLKHGDGTYMTSGSDTYTYTNDRWVCGNHPSTTITNASDATCTEAGYTGDTVCTLCGAVTASGNAIAAIGHSYSSVVTAPTCTEKGYTTYTCACGYSYTADEVAATGHSWNSGDVTTQPGCETEGVKTFSCTVCGSTKTETVAVKGHNYVAGTPVPATCTTDGYTPYTCSNGCGSSYNGDIVAALGHTEEIVAGTAATCTATGLTDGKKCTVCGTVTVAQEVIDKLSHTEEAVAGKAATCTEDGLADGTKCSVCGETVKAQETIPATGHTEETVPGTPATCTEPGLTDGKKCTVCGAVTLAQTEIPASGHQWENGVCTVCQDECEHEYKDGTCTVCSYGCPHSYESVVTDPTCTEQGYTTYTCPTCENSYIDDYVPALGHDMADATCTEASTCSREGCSHTDGDPLGHNYGAVVTAPTCTAQGYTTHTCSRCSDSYVDTYVDATGHTEGTPVVENEVAATCTDEGSYDNVVYCTVCNAELSRDTVTVPATGHTDGEAVTENNVDATCTDDGSYDTVTYCTVCGEETSRVTTTVPATGHTAGAGVTENETAATCTAGGSYDTVVYCSSCNGELSRETTTVPATGHTNGEAVVENEVAPTCANGGSYDSVVYCTVCSTEVSRTPTTVAALGHKYESAVTAPTCTAEGYTTYTCTVCGDTCTGDTTAALGHTDGDPVVENEVAATCTADGSYDTVTYCTVCGVETSRETTTVPAAGHTAEAVAGKDATCTETGLTEGSKCSVCGETLTAQEEIPALGHSYDDGVVTTEPTCTAEGVKTFTCTACDDTYTESVAATGHSHEAVVTAPTCTEGGYTTYTCTICGDSYKDNYVDALGHSYTSEVTTAATCTVAGVKTYTCSACGDRYTEEIAATGHAHEAVVTAPTCTEAGYTTYTCACGDTYTADEVAALGHSYESVVTAPTCATAGYTTHTCSVCGDSYTDSETAATGEHSYVDGKCIGCGADEPVVITGSIRLRSASLNLEDMICIIYKCTDDTIVTNNEYVAERGVLLYKTEELAATRDPAQAAETVLLEWDESQQRYVGKSEGIEARYMDQSRFAVAYVKMVDGTYIFGTNDGEAQTIEYSPLIYCQKKKDTPGIVGTLCSALMQYGAAAQVAQLGESERPAVLMNDGFADVPYDESVLGETVLVTNTTVTNGMQLKSASLVLLGAISYNVKYTVDESIADKQLYAEYTLLGETKSVELTDGHDDGRLWATINGVLAKDMGSALTVKPYYLDENGEKVYGGELVYSGYEYIRRAPTNKNLTDADKALAKALAMFIHYADEYGN